MSQQMKTLNGYEVVDGYARTQIDNIESDIGNIETNINNLLGQINDHTHGWNDLEDKPFYEEQVTNVILDETNETEVFQGSFSSSIYGQDIPRIIIVGESYVVTFDGVKYNCVAWKSGNNYITLGNSQLGEEQDDSHVENVPFAIQYYVGDIYGDGYIFSHCYYIYYENYDSTHTVKIEELLDDVTYHTLDEKFIPDTIARKSDLENIEIPEGQIQADWNQNDETAIDYVKNRTHYVEIGKQLLLAEQSITSINLSDQMQDYTAIDGETFIVTVDGIAYECTSWSYVGEIYLGDSRIFSDNEDLAALHPEDVPFIIWHYIYWGDPFEGTEDEIWWDITFTDSEAHTVKIERISDKVVYHALDEKFIPDTIARVSYVDKKAGRKENVEGAEIFNNYIANNATGKYSHAEGSLTEASGYASHAEGESTTASAHSSHAEGNGTTASGIHSHAEGMSTTASGIHSHAEGTGTKASGDYSHAEGYIAKASGKASHAEGYGTTASGIYQHVQGKYNIEDTEDKYAHIVGNGDSSDNRSNAHTLDWNGNAWYAGIIKVGGTSYEDAFEVALKSDLENIEIPEGFSGSWNDLTDKPFYEEQVKEIVVSECTVTAKYNEYTFSYWTDITSNAQSPQFNSGGEDFIVTVDGISYECTSWVNASYNADTFFIGDSRFMGEGDNDIYYTNQEDVPFLVEFYFEQVGWSDREFSSATIYLKDSASHTIKVERLSEESQIITLNEKFIPDTIARIDNVITKIDPVIEGSFSLNRKVGSTIGYHSFAEGEMTTASGSASHAEGNNTTASGQYSHAEGNTTTASGYYSHAEGVSTTASGNTSHAEGYLATASGNYSHTEGYRTTSSGEASHAEGYRTYAGSENQHVQGKWNVEDNINKYAHIVGNGDADDNRSNAHTLDWNGKGWFKDSVYVGGTGQDDTDAKKLATEEYVDSLFADYITDIATILGGDA